MNGYVVVDKGWIRKSEIVEFGGYVDDSDDYEDFSSDDEMCTPIREASMRPYQSEPRGIGSLDYESELYTRLINTTSKVERDVNRRDLSMIRAAFNAAFIHSKHKDALIMAEDLDIRKAKQIVNKPIKNKSWILLMI